MRLQPELTRFRAPRVSTLSLQVILAGLIGFALGALAALCL